MKKTVFLTLALGVISAPAEEILKNCQVILPYQCTEVSNVTHSTQIENRKGQRLATLTVNVTCKIEHIFKFSGETLVHYGYPLRWIAFESKYTFDIGSYFESKGLDPKDYPSLNITLPRITLEATDIPDKVDGEYDPENVEDPVLTCEK